MYVGPSESTIVLAGRGVTAEPEQRCLYQKPTTSSLSERTLTPAGETMVHWTA